MGAGGTPGGTPQFLIGVCMMGLGLYLLLQSIMVTQNFSLGYTLYAFPGSQAHITSGMVLIPLCAGIAFIFQNARSLLGWSLFVGSLAALVFGVLASIHFVMRPMSLFDLLSMLFLVFGGLGLFLRALSGRHS